MTTALLPPKKTYTHLSKNLYTISVVLWIKVGLQEGRGRTSIVTDQEVDIGAEPDRSKVLVAHKIFERHALHNPGFSRYLNEEVGLL